MFNKKTFLFAAFIAFFSFKSVDTVKWNLDNTHAKIGFSVTHLMLSEVDGYFKKVSATVTSSKADFTDAVAEMTAEVSSINTDNEGRDNHLQAPDFFDAAKYPTIAFKSTSFKKGNGNSYVVKGKLTMHGITKEIVLDAIAKTGENPMSKKTVTGFKITGKVNRKDFGIGAETPNAMLSEIVEIRANAEFVKE